jgi:hypothetical protein
LYDDNPQLQSIADRGRESLVEQQTTTQTDLESLKSDIEKLSQSDSEESNSTDELWEFRQQERMIRTKLKGIERKIDSLGEIAVDPVVPSMDRLGNAQWGWADLPFVKPQLEKQLFNYWLMDKGRMVSLPFTLFSTGFNLFLYSLFIVVVDIGGLQAGVFRTLGQNPLAAYIIHGMVQRGFHDLTPDDSPLWWTLVFGIFFGTTYLMVQYLEKHRLFLRL